MFLFYPFSIVFYKVGKSNGSTTFIHKKVQAIPVITHNSNMYHSGSNQMNQNVRIKWVKVSRMMMPICIPTQIDGKIKVI